MLLAPGLALAISSVVLQRKRGGTLNGEHRDELVPVGAE
jgi:hypothetical protein